MFRLLQQWLSWQLALCLCRLSYYKFRMSWPRPMLKFHEKTYFRQMPKAGVTELIRSESLRQTPRICSWITKISEQRSKKRNSGVKIIHYAVRNRKSEENAEYRKSLSLLAVILSLSFGQLAVIIGTAKILVRTCLANKVHQTTKTHSAKRGTICTIVMERLLLRMQLILSMLLLKTYKATTGKILYVEDFHPNKVAEIFHKYLDMEEFMPRNNSARSETGVFALRKWSPMPIWWLLKWPKMLALRSFDLQLALTGSYPTDSLLHPLMVWSTKWGWHQKVDWDIWIGEFLTAFWRYR